MSSTVRSSKRKFIEWIEELAYRTIGEILPPQANWEEKEKKIPDMIQMLSSHLNSTGKTGIVIIDGLDELINQGHNSLFDFLCIIPLTLPANLRIIISCTSKDILPPQIKEFLHQKQEEVFLDLLFTDFLQQSLFLSRYRLYTRAANI